MENDVRKLAVQSLLRCESGAFSHLVMKEVLGSPELEERDRAFFTVLFLGTLSRQISIDRILSCFLKKGVASLDPEIRAILRLGTYQLQWMDGVPQYAAISESVNLCRKFRKSSASKLVNAVLRRASECRLEELTEEENGAQRLSDLYSVNLGLAELLISEYGENTEQILRATLDGGGLFLRVNTRKNSQEELKDQIASAEFTALPNCLKISGSVASVSGILEAGDATIEGFPAQVAAACVGAQTGENVLDLCSAPGGKTVCLAQEVGDTGRVIAVELYQHRASLVTDLARRLQLPNVEVICCDGREYRPGYLFDRVLCDVPCSGYGELASKPELRAKDPEGSADLPRLQMELLCHAAGLLRKGGTLVYSTCTLLRRENEDIVRSFLSEHPDFDGSPITVGDVGAEAVSPFEWKFIPSAGQPEGFYIASLRKL